MLKNLTGVVGGYIRTEKGGKIIIWVENDLSKIKEIIKNV
jgi:hypothetical protein